MPVNLTDPINLCLKDPIAGPDLVEPLRIPPCPVELPFMVLGFDGGGFAPDTYAGRAAAAYYVMATSIPKAIARFGKVPRWPGTVRLMVQPSAGVALNAFYDRRALNFCFQWDPGQGHWIYAASALDVVAHEMGHAILDSVRPDLWSYPLPEIGAMHESFGDIHAMSALMSHDKTLDSALRETGGNLSRSNIISRLGEEMGRLFNHAPPGVSAPLRDAANDFRYVPPGTLPPTGSRDSLVNESHSFSRVFTGAAYEIMVGIYNRRLQAGNPPMDALRTAGEMLVDHIFKAALSVPASANFYENYARSVLVVAAGGDYHQLMSEVFARRQILAGVGVLTVSEGVHDCTTRFASEEVVLADAPLIAALGDNPLYKVRVDCPLDEWRGYSRTGRQVAAHRPDRTDLLGHIRHFLDVLHLREMVGEGKAFRIQSGKLVRNHISYQ